MGHHLDNYSPNAFAHTFTGRLYPCVMCPPRVCPPVSRAHACFSCSLQKYVWLLFFAICPGDRVRIVVFPCVLQKVHSTSIDAITPSRHVPFPCNPSIGNTTSAILFPGDHVGVREPICRLASSHHRSRIGISVCTHVRA